MAENGEAGTHGSASVPATAGPVDSPRCVELFSRGITSSEQFAQAFSALMGDLASGRLTPNVGNAICNAGGKMLKVKEMEIKYGTTGPGQGRKILELS